MTKTRNAVNLAQRGLAVFTICAIAGAGLAIALVVVFPLLLAAFGLTSFDHPIIGYLRWPLMFVLIILGLAVLYRYGPTRQLAKWRGSRRQRLRRARLARFPAVLWYLFHQLQRHLGAPQAAVGLMMWMAFDHRVGRR
jgi:membrane protein